MNDLLNFDVKIEEGLPSKILKDNNIVKIAIIGVGGAGCNMLNYMIKQQISRVDLIAINTDLQHLNLSEAPKKILIGKTLTNGLGAGMKPEIGKESAQEDQAEIQEAIEGVNIVFIAAGMGGGTGTGASPVIAKIAKENGAKVVSVITKPFPYEGKLKLGLANFGYEELKKESDAIIVIKNEKILEIDKKLTVQEAFNKVNSILYQAVSGMIDVILNVSEDGMNTDFSDIETILEYKGLALMAIGKGSGDEAAKHAIEEAINSPLLDNISLKKAKGLIVHWTHNPKLSFLEMTNAMNLIHEYCSNDVKLKFGRVESNDIGIDELKVIIIATGFEANQENDKTSQDNPQSLNISKDDPNYYEIPPLMRGYEIKYQL
jgi:cell division protein FtsZ